MLSFAAPQFAWFLLLPAGIVVLYLLRRKYVPREVPSTFLWRTAIRDHTANKPLQKLRKNLLMPVQLLAALVLALALMQPNLSGGAASRTVMIFDLSGSMQTVSSGKSRLDEAKDRAEELLRGLPPGEEITVLAASDEVRQVLTGSTDREDARRAIRGLACGREGADLDKAVSLAEAIRREETDRGTRILVFSDNYLPKAGTGAVNAGQGEENRGVYSLSAEEGSAYARICNFGGDCVVTVSCEADGVLCEAKEVEIPAGETAGVLFAIPEGAVKAEVRIREQDALAADNRAEAPVLRNAVRTVALAGDSLFLESALAVRPDLRIIRVSTDPKARTGNDGGAPDGSAGTETESDLLNAALAADREALAGTEADLYIYGSSPLIFTRDPSRTVFSWSAEREAAGALTAEDTPVTQGLTLRNVTLRSCRTVSGGRAAIRAGGDAVAAYTESEAVVGFRLQDSNLPLKYDFPVLVQNVLNWLLPKAAEAVPDTVAPMDAAESDVRTVAPDAAGEESAAAMSRGQDLTGWLMGVFLVLLVLEFVLAREPWVKRRIARDPSDSSRGYRPFFSENSPLDCFPGAKNPGMTSVMNASENEKDRPSVLGSRKGARE